MSSWESSILSLTYSDVAKVFRLEKFKDGEFTETQYVEVGSIKCAIDKKEVTQISEMSSVAMEYVLFADTYSDVREGDTLEVTRFGDTITFEVGAIYKYSSHLEGHLERKERV